MDAAGIAFVLPAFVTVLGLLIFPVLSSFYYSTTSRHLLRATYEFIGLQNYSSLVDSAAFWSSFTTSVRWTLYSIIGQVGLGFVLALALNSVNRGSSFYRTALIIPWAFPAIIIGFGWRWILNDVYGVLPNTLTALGATEANVSALANPGLAFPTAVAVNVWFGAPLFMVTILSALKTIPHEQIEAARVDGANAWQGFRYITLRHVRNVVGLLVILRTIWVFNNFELLFLLTGGGPGDLTTTLPIFAYRTGWSLHQMGRAAAVTVLLLVLLLTFALLAFRLLNRWAKEDA